MARLNPPSPDFLTACERAQNRVGVAVWPFLRPRECTDAIYRELRALDLARLGREQGVSAAFMDS